MVPQGEGKATIVIRFWIIALILAMIGPRRPWGNHAHLEEFSHGQPLWGRRGNVSSIGRPVMRPAMDSTRSAQQAAIIQTLKNEWTKI